MLVTACTASSCQEQRTQLQPPMPNQLDTRLEDLKAHQRTLILGIAEHDGLPAGSALRQVAELVH